MLEHASHPTTNPSSSSGPSTPVPSSEIAATARAQVVVLARDLATAEAYVADLARTGHRAIAAPRGRELPSETLKGLAIVVDADVLAVSELRKSGALDVPAIPDPGEGAPPLESVARLAYEEAERRYIVRVLARFDGNRTRAARMLKVSRSTLWQKLRRYGLEESTRSVPPPPSADNVATSPRGS